MSAPPVFPAPPKEYDANQIAQFQRVLTMYLNTLSGASLLNYVSLYPTVTSAASPDIFGAAGATISIDNSTPVTTTDIADCTAAQVGSTKRVIPVQAWTVTASANMTVDGATSGNTTYPANAELEIRALTTSTFAIRTVFAQGTWTPDQGSGLTVVGAFSSSGTYTIRDGMVKLTARYEGATSIAVAAAGVMSTNLPFANKADSIYLGSAFDAATNTSSYGIRTKTLAPNELAAVPAIAATVLLFCDITYIKA